MVKLEKDGGYKTDPDINRTDKLRYGSYTVFLECEMLIDDIVKYGTPKKRKKSIRYYKNKNKK